MPIRDQVGLVGSRLQALHRFGGRFDRLLKPTQSLQPAAPH